MSKITKEQVLETSGSFTWFWGVDFLIETSLGNFHWIDGSYGPPGTQSTMTLFEGDYKDFCEKLNVPYGRDKGIHTVKHYCGTDFEMI